MGREKYTDTLPDGSIIDLDAYDWGEHEHLLKRQKLLIIWYTTPGQNGYKNPTVAAQKAGYSTKTSYVAKHKLIKENPTVLKLIQKFTDEQIKVSVKEAVDKLVSARINRATYNIKDFYQNQEYKTESGEVRSITTIIPLENIDAEKASIIDNIEITNTGIPTYKLPNREKEMSELIKLNEQLNGDTSKGEYDVETTVDMIRENFATVKTTIKMRNQEIREAAGEYIETNENQPDYD